MKKFLGLVGFVTLASFAADVPSIGNFEGIVFSGVTSRQPVKILSGTFHTCEKATEAISKCLVQDGSLEVTGAAESALKVTFTSANILFSQPQYASTHYYYKGTTEMTIGGKRLAIPVSLVLNVEDKDRTHASGVIELPQQNTKSTFEVFRN